MPPKTANPAGSALPSEESFLAAIAANLNDDAARLVYADWLEEQGDPRAKYVRDLVTAVKSLGASRKLPKSKHPEEWTTLLGVPLYAGLIATETTELRASLLRLARPAVSLVTKPKKQSAIPIGASKFGGDADLPKSVEWPKWERGYLGFLCQINLADLRGMPAAAWLPESGLLSFFAWQSFDDGHQPGQMADACGDTQVVYSPSSAKLARRKRPVVDEDDFDDEEANGPRPSCAVTLAPAWDLPSARDAVPPGLAADLARFQSDDLYEKLHEIRSEILGFGHHLLGYSVHFRTDDPTPGPEWAHLLCLDSDDNLGWSWCDGEHLAVYMKQNQIDDRTFAGASGYAS